MASKKINSELKYLECDAHCASLAIKYLIEEVSGLVSCTLCRTSYSRTAGGHIMIHTQDSHTRHTEILYEIYDNE
jgi:hypothetical protein